ncbi:MAG: hypothetical protein Q4A65_04285 [Bacillota bacterium]|nr:hypothetical protein [Bacillota bacterium]
MERIVCGKEMIIYYDLRRVPLFKPYFEASGIHHENQFRNLATFLIHESRIRKYFSNYFFFKVPKVDPDDDIIIAFDSKTNSKHLNRICARYPDKRIIYWCWNPVTNPKLFDLFDERIQVWTYSRADSIKYGIKLNTQFYFDCLTDEATASFREPSRPSPKVLFLGRDKGRAQALGSIEALLKEHGAKTEFILTEPPKYKAAFEKLMPYREVINKVKASDILLDYYLDTTAGLSLRPMEAMFWGKKLITNMESIRDQDFYDPNNIYVLGEDRSLDDFFMAPYRPVDPEIKNRYLISNWIRRFDRNEE